MRRFEIFLLFYTLPTSSTKDFSLLIFLIYLNSLCFLQQISMQYIWVVNLLFEWKYNLNTATRKGLLVY